MVIADGAPSHLCVLALLLPIHSCSAPKAGQWSIGVLPGPNAAPDYFTPEDITTLYSSPYSVHYNS